MGRRGDTDQHPLSAGRISAIGASPRPPCSRSEPILVQSCATKHIRVTRYDDSNGSCQQEPKSAPVSGTEKCTTAPVEK
jgi:hypothetical protein